MVFKVYNNNGKVKVTKMQGIREVTMFSDIQDGEMAEIEVDTSSYTRSHKKPINSRKGMEQTDV